MQYFWVSVENNVKKYYYLFIRENALFYFLINVFIFTFDSIEKFYQVFFI